MNDAEKRIKSLVDGRETAETVLGMLYPWQREDEHFMAAFVQEIIKSSGLAVEARKPEIDKTPACFERLRSTTIEFGKYAGLTYDEVPLNYLDWICGQQEDSLLLLRGYLMHPQLKNHIRDYVRK